MRSRRYLVPVGIAGLIAVGTAIPHLSSASAATPDLPSITAQQLLVKVQQSHVAGLSGTVELSPDLGLPSLTGLTGGDGQSFSTSGFDPTSLLSGDTTFKVWDAGSSEQRLALSPSATTEIDVVRDGDQLWTSDSSTQHVVHYVAAPHHSGQAAAPPAGTPPTPQEAASDFLSSLTPTTDVSVVTPVFVAGRPTYELRLVPKAADSTVAAVTFAVDSATGAVLQVQVSAKGQAAPALSLGYTSVSFAVPAAAEFAPLVGASEVTRTLGGAHPDHPAWHTDAAAHPAAPAGPASPGGHHGRWMGHGMHHGSMGHHASLGHLSQPTTSGTGWGTVVTVRTGALSPAATRQLDQLSTPVTLADGTAARLVTTHLLNAVVLPDGTVTAGLVTPAALEAAAAAAPAAAAPAAG